MSKESFKIFVKEKPSLVEYVNRGEMTWQKFYEMYEMYGDKSEIWNKYTSSNASLRNLFSAFKTMDMEEVQKGITSLQKGIGYIKDIVKDKTPDRKEEYEPRKIYKHFDD